jgi:predicted adenylyl cyclase CyaB
MRQNLELKARHDNLPAARASLARLGARHDGSESQTNTYFAVAVGRLKLRVTDGRHAVLIWYQRPNSHQPRLSSYLLVPVHEPSAMRALLATAFGIQVEVRKLREIHHWHNVRIHLDVVARLGTFVEFEAVLSETDDEATARGRLDQLARALGIEAGSLIAQSYSDLLGQDQAERV